ncbi:MAG TPA: DUF2064 domain-containing protein [Solirubrobacteraceae bacterium]
MTAAPRPAALVLAQAPSAAGGAYGGSELRAALVRRAVGWACEVGEPWLAYAPAAAEAELRELAGPDVALMAQAEGDEAARLAAATAAVLERHGGPLLVAGVEEPRLGPAHAAAALEDLATGADFVIGPALDGGWYLLGLARPLPDLFALDPALWSSADVMPLAIAAAQGAGLEVGLLRPEQPLRTPAQGRAALRDPLFPPEIAALL